MKEEYFYSRLPSFEDFHGVSKHSSFAKVPATWIVWIADIKGSTEAILQGRYKDVNMLGAACIAAATNTLKGQDFPYIFGGDGATFLTPIEDFKELSESMAELILLAEQNFAFDLRVGVVPLSDLYAKGHQIELAKHRLASGKCLSAISGSGLAVAEKLIKTSGSSYLIEKAQKITRDMMEGLSCRWQPISPRNGRVLSLIIMSAEGEDHEIVFSEVLMGLEKILDSKLAEANPLLTEQKYFEGFFKNLKTDLKLSRKLLHFRTMKRLFGTILAFVLFRLKFRFVFKEMDRYAQSFAAHSDFIKFEGGLKMTLDCTSKQIQRIESFLQDQHESGKIFYGLQQSTSTLMTCFVPSVDEGQHVHFVDASDGGYTLAAKGLKQQMKSMAINQ